VGGYSIFFFGSGRKELFLSLLKGGLWVFYRSCDGGFFRLLFFSYFFFCFSCLSVKVYPTLSFGLLVFFCAVLLLQDRATDVFFVVLLVDAMVTETGTDGWL